MAFSGFSDTTTPQPKKDVPRISGSEAVIRSFLAEGVETIFISSVANYNITQLKDMLWRALNE